MSNANETKHTPGPLNATAMRDFPGTCGHMIAQGERCEAYRERALSHSEAAHAGTLYPRRFRCAKCSTARAALAKARGQA